MERFANRIALITLLTCLGCGTKVAEKPVALQTESSREGNAQTDQKGPSATDVVSLFLDQIRRGGENSAAGQLLTQRAQAELKRIGRTVQPLGSPDARFVVTRAEIVPGEENSALVHSVWSEPGEQNVPIEYQVVWAVQKEAQGWRISGLAMELEPNQDPMIIDFENGDRMAQLLAAPEETQDSAVANSAAAQPDPAISR